MNSSARWQRICLAALILSLVCLASFMMSSQEAYSEEAAFWENPYAVRRDENGRFILFQQASYRFPLDTIDEVNFYATHVFVGKVTSISEYGQGTEECRIEVSEWLKGEATGKEISVEAFRGVLKVGKEYLLATESYQALYAPYPIYAVLRPETAIVEINRDGTIIGEKNFIAGYKHSRELLEHVRTSDSVLALDSRREEFEPLFPAEEKVASILKRDGLSYKGKAISELVQKGNAAVTPLLNAQFEAADFVLRAKVTSVAPISKYMGEARVEVIEEYKGEWPKEYHFWVPRDFASGQEYILFASKEDSGSLIKLSFSDGASFKQDSMEWEVIDEFLVSNR